MDPSLAFTAPAQVVSASAKEPLLGGSLGKSRLGG